MDIKKTVCENRLEIMGIATILVVLYHAGFSTNIVLKNIFGVGYIGVDLFMFLSGFSMFQSFSKTCDRNVGCFYLKRLKKILLPYLFWFMLVYPLDLRANHISVCQLLEMMKTFEYWHELVVYKWYVWGIAVCYFFTPLVDRFLVGSLNVRKAIANLLIVYLVVVLVSMPFWGKSTILMCLLRLPTYFLGYFIACYGVVIKNSKPGVIVCSVLALLSICMIIFFANRYNDVTFLDFGLGWYPMLIGTFPVLVCICACLKQICQNFCLKLFFRFIGEHSFEIYLWDTTTREIFVFFKNPLGSTVLDNLRIGVSILFTMMLAIIWKKLISVVLRFK